MAVLPGLAHGLPAMTQTSKPPIRSMCGMSSPHFDGTRAVQVSGGSVMWVSAPMTGDRSNMGRSQGTVLVRVNPHGSGRGPEEHVDQVGAERLIGDQVLTALPARPDRRRVDEDVGPDPDALGQQR